MDEGLIFTLISSAVEKINTESSLLSLNVIKSDLPVQVNALCTSGVDVFTFSAIVDEIRLSVLSFSFSDH